MALSSFLGAVSQPPTGHRACPHQLSAGLVPPNAEPEDEDVRPITVGEMFLNTVKLFPDKRALRYKESDQSDWTDINYAEYYKYSIAAAKSFVKVCPSLYKMHGIFAITIVYAALALLLLVYPLSGYLADAHCGR